MKSTKEGNVPKDEVVVDGVKNVRSDRVKRGAGPATKKRIVILQRGWVLVGDLAKVGQEYILSDASVIRVWGTAKGLGELALCGPLGSTKLDKCGTARFNEGALVAMLDVEAPEKW